MTPGRHYGNTVAEAERCWRGLGGASYYPENSEEPKAASAGILPAFTIRTAKAGKMPALRLRSGVRTIYGLGVGVGWAPRSSWSWTRVSRAPSLANSVPRSEAVLRRSRAWHTTPPQGFAACRLAPLLRPGTAAPRRFAQGPRGASGLAADGRRVSRCAMRFAGRDPRKCWSGVGWGCGCRLPGFSRDKAIPVAEDSLRRSVGWQGRGITNLPAGRYMLRLHLKNATVYAFRIRK